MIILRNNSPYTIDQKPQLIDLNQDTVNFDITFTVKGDPQTSFEYLVIDQTILDNNPDFECKQTTGSISGNIISNKGIYQNYYLVLKAPQPCQLDVYIDKKEVAQELPAIPQQVALPEPKSSKINWKFIFLLVALGIVVYLLFFKKDGKKLIETAAKKTTKLPKHVFPSSPVGSPNISDRINNFSFE